VGIDGGVLDVAASLGPERAVLLDLLQGLAPDDWHRPTECPAWNVKGIALHILGDDLSLLTRQRDASTDSLTLYAEHHAGLGFRELLDGFNEEWVATARFFSPALVIDMLRLVGEWSEAFYCNVGLDTLSREPVGFFASTEPSPYWQVIAREYIERFVHQSQIRRAVGAPELHGETVAVAARVAVHALARWLVDYEPAIGSTIAIEFGDPGAWTWQRDPDCWSVLEGVAVAPTATVTVASGRAVAMLSRGVSPDDARGAITITGAPMVARPALDLIAPILGRPPS
jgi:uncharacterized protein (TIGR03083 family)